MISKSIARLLLLTLFAGLSLILTASAEAQLKSIAGIGKITLTASGSELGPGYVIYLQAHLTTPSGSSLDSDRLMAITGPGNQLSQATATGHVKADVIDATTKRTYVVTADEAVYDPTADTIELTGNVKAVITSDLTQGPLVQTGTSATIQLGKTPDFPKIIMRQVHTEFSVKQ